MGVFIGWVDVMRKRGLSTRGSRLIRRHRGGGNCRCRATLPRVRPGRRRWYSAEGARLPKEGETAPGRFREIAADSWPEESEGRFPRDPAEQTQTGASSPVFSLRRQASFGARGAPCAPPQRSGLGARPTAGKTAAEMADSSGAIKGRTWPATGAHRQPFRPADGALDQAEICRAMPPQAG